MTIFCKARQLPDVTAVFHLDPLTLGNLKFRGRTNSHSEHNIVVCWIFFGGESPLSRLNETHCDWSTIVGKLTLVKCHKTLVVNA